MKTLREATAGEDLAVTVLITKDLFLCLIAKDNMLFQLVHDTITFHLHFFYIQDAGFNSIIGLPILPSYFIYSGTMQSHVS